MERLLTVKEVARLVRRKVITSGYCIVVPTAERAAEILNQGAFKKKKPS